MLALAVFHNVFFTEFIRIASESWYTLPPVQAERYDLDLPLGLVRFHS